MSTLLEVGYLAFHLCHVLRYWLYRLSILFAHRFLYRFFSLSTEAYLDHEYKIVLRDYETTLLTRLRRLSTASPLLTRPDGSFYLFAPPTQESDNSTLSSFSGFYYLRAARIDTPSVAFLRIVHRVHHIATSSLSDAYMKTEFQSSGNVE
jgi:hypothetical protein